MTEKYILGGWKRNLKKKLSLPMSCETMEKLSGNREEDWLFQQQGEANRAKGKYIFISLYAVISDSNLFGIILR